MHVFSWRLVNSELPTAMVRSSGKAYRGRLKMRAGVFEFCSKILMKIVMINYLTVPGLLLITGPLKIIKDKTLFIW